MEAYFSGRFLSMVPITKGYSADEKYRVTENGADYLLRISPPERHEAGKWIGYTKSDRKNKVMVE